MRAKVAKKLLAERDELAKKSSEAAVALARAVIAEGAAREAERQAKVALVEANDALVAAETRYFATNDLAAKAEGMLREHEGLVAKAKAVAEGLAAKASDPRFAEAEAALARYTERQEKEATKAAPLSPENVEGLRFLRRVFMAAPRKPSHADHEGREITLTRAEKKILREQAGVDTSTPCDECGAAPGEPCKPGVKHNYEDVD